MPPIHRSVLDKGLEVVQWAIAEGSSEKDQLLKVDLGVRPTAMAHSTATGQSLLTNGALGADIIRLGAGEGFVPHTHPGDHLLFVLGGQGTITYGGKIYPTQAGQAFMVEGEVPHAVGAITDHAILAIGSPHRAVDDPDRMAPVEYDAVTVDIGSLTCLICEVTATAPTRVHDLNCSHCPCQTCLGANEEAA